jgi:hypothetical protein
MALVPEYLTELEYILLYLGLYVPMHRSDIFVDSVSQMVEQSVTEGVAVRLRQVP